VLGATQRTPTVGPAGWADSSRTVPRPGMGAGCGLCTICFRVALLGSASAVPSAGAAPSSTPCVFFGSGHACESTDPKVTLAVINEHETSLCTLHESSPWGTAARRKKRRFAAACRAAPSTSEATSTLIRDLQDKRQRVCDGRRSRPGVRVWSAHRV